MNFDYVTQSFDHDRLQRFAHDVEQRNESIRLRIDIVAFLQFA